MKPLHAGDAYISLGTTTALNTVCRSDDDVLVNVCAFYVVVIAVCSVETWFTAGEVPQQQSVGDHRASKQASDLGPR